MGLRFEKEYEVNYYNVDAKERLKLTSIADFLCDIGMRQSDSLDMTIDKMMALNMAWIFYKYDIEVIRYPLLGEKIKVITEAIGMKKFYGYRIYEIRDEKDNLVIKGKGTFMMLNLEKRRAMRVPTMMNEIFKCGENTFEITSLNKNIECDLSQSFKVRYSDIDTNYHVNNTRYMEWALETVPRDIISEYTMNHIEVNFLREVTYGHTINANAKILSKDDDTIIIYHKITDEEGKALALCQTTWKK